jgi:hypothetical protein
VTLQRAQCGLQLAERIVKAGFTVYMPLFFGKVGESSSVVAVNGNALVNSINICIQREFYLLKTGESSPITDWVRSLCRHIYYERSDHKDYKGIGAIGMCLTGGLIFSLVAPQANFTGSDKAQAEKANLSPVIAPVSCQPALPLSLPCCPKLQQDLGISQSDLTSARKGTEALGKEFGHGMLVVRFQQDFISSQKRLEEIQAQFPTPLVKVCSINAEGSGIPLCPPPHATLTENFAPKGNNPFAIKEHDPYPETQEALNTVLEFFHERLK